MSYTKIIRTAQNINILTITKCTDDFGGSSLQETVPRRQQSEFAERNLFSSWCDACLNETFLQWILGWGWGWSVRFRAVSGQPCLPKTIDCPVSYCFITTKMTIKIINVDANFRYTNYSDAFVCGRLPSSNIPKFHQISVTCWCVFPC